MRTKRGLCRCGEILQFAKGPQGYKTRCSSCGSVVRLRLPRKRRKHKVRPLAQTSIPVVEQDPLALIEQMAEVAPPSDGEAAVPPPLPKQEQQSPQVVEMLELEPWDQPPPPTMSWRTLLGWVLVGTLLVIGGGVGAVWFFNR